MEQCLLKSVDETLMGIRVEGESVDLWVKIPWIFETGFVHASPRSIEFASLRGILGGDRESEAQLWLPFLHSSLSIWGHWFWGVGHVVCVIFARGKSWSVVSGHCCLSFLGVGSLRGFAVVGVVISLFFSVMELCECCILILYVFGWRFLRAMVKTVRFVCWLFWFLCFCILGSGMLFCGCFRLLCLVCVVFCCFLCADCRVMGMCFVVLFYVGGWGICGVSFLFCWFVVFCCGVFTFVL